MALPLPHKKRPPIVAGAYMNPGRSRIDLLGCGLLSLGNDGLEGGGVVHCQVGKHLAVDFDAGLVQAAHQFAVGHTFQACGGIDTLNPQSAEVTFLVSTVAECVSQTFFPRILGNGPHVLACAIVATGQLKDSFSLGT